MMPQYLESITFGLSLLLYIPMDTDFEELLPMRML